MTGIGRIAEAACAAQSHGCHWAAGLVPAQPQDMNGRAATHQLRPKICMDLRELLQGESPIGAWATPACSRAITRRRWRSLAINSGRRRRDVPTREATPGLRPGRRRKAKQQTPREVQTTIVASAEKVS